MKKIFNRQMVRSALMTLAVTASTMTAVAPVSCKLTDEGVEVAPADTTAPTVEEFALIDDKTISLTCSKKIVLSNVSVLELESDEEIDSSDFDLQEKTEFVTDDSITYSEDKKSAKIALSQQTAVGKNYVFSGIVYDEQGNSLEFQQKFCGFNANPARLIFNEVRAKASTTKVEFIELYVLKSGNICGLELVSSAQGEANKYTLPSIDVQRGEYITVHGRILENMAESAIDELGNDLTLSSANESHESARDLWINGEKAFFTNNDVVVLRNSNTGKLEDALLICPESTKKWSSNLKNSFAESAYSTGIWTTGSSVENAIHSDLASKVTVSISRQNTAELAEKYNESTPIPDVIPTCADDWLIVSEITPGYENSTNAYAK